mmetsp:Transcript_17315/g.31066  ORF Transcript_17315/g.31066 Transcript_17315/m.31066 type:complete len:83 (+) Transcript_17315:28-276(+)
MSSNAKADEKKSDKAEDVKKTDTKGIENLLEEDDEFEEFPQETWGQKDEDQEDEKLWEDNWDDDDVDANFSEQLRAEISKAK